MGNLIHLCTFRRFTINSVQSLTMQYGITISVITLAKKQVAWEKGKTER